MRYLQNLGSMKKKYEKSHFMLIFGELLVCSLQNKIDLAFLSHLDNRQLNFAST